MYSIDNSSDTPSRKDYLVFKAIDQIPAGEYPNVQRWFMETKGFVCKKYDAMLKKKSKQTGKRRFPNLQGFGSKKLFLKIKKLIIK